MSDSRPVFGIVGLDTSHADAWVRLLQARGDTIAVYDDGTVRTAEYARRFCAERNIVLCSSLAELAAAADIIAILGCDWDRHVATAAPFVAAGKTVYIDKPVACRDTDLSRLVAWEGKPLVLGSCNRFEPRLLALRGTALTRVESYTSQRGDFYYPIHAVEVGQTLLGVGAKRVRWLPDRSEPTCEVEHAACASWLIGWERQAPGVEVIAETPAGRKTIGFPPGGPLQIRLIDEVLRVHEGGKPLVSAAEAVEAIRVLRAAYTAQRLIGAWIDCAAPGLDEFSGAAFAAEYRRTIVSQ